MRDKLKSRLDGVIVRVTFGSLPELLSPAWVDHVQKSVGGLWRYFDGEVRAKEFFFEDLEVLSPDYKKILPREDGLAEIERRLSAEFILRN